MHTVTNKYFISIATTCMYNAWRDALAKILMYKLAKYVNSIVVFKTFAS